MKTRPLLFASAFLALAIYAGSCIAAPSRGAGRKPAAASAPADEAARLLERARRLTGTTEGGRTEYTAESFPLFLRAAELGNADAQFAVGECYFYGIDADGFEVNESLAATWYAKAAGQGHAQAMDGLANCYEHGRGVEEDQQKAFELHKQSLAAGNQGALDSLAYCYFYGWGVAPDDEKAIEYSLRACEQGNSNLEFFWVDREKAIFKMEDSTPNVRGRMEKTANRACMQMRRYLASRLPGEALPEQPQQLLARCKELARQGDGEAAYHVASCLEEGYYVEDGDVGGMDGEQALVYHGMALEAGYDASLFALGQLYEYHPGIESDRETAYFWYELAAERGHYEAARIVARHNVSEPIDDESAYTCCRASALNPGSHEARRDVEEVLRSGKVSVSMMRYLAGQGNREAMAYLGECYEQGLQGVKQDAARAALCYRRAAEQGSPLAQFRLGRCYAAGLGVPQDWQKAADLFGQAARAEQASDVLTDDGDPMPPPYFGALREWAKCYELGLGVEKSALRAIELYLEVGKADGEGDVKDSAALAALEGMAAKGLIPEGLEEPAQRLLCGKALFYVYENGALAEAERLPMLQRAAAQGEPQASFLLSWKYEAGDGVPKDTARYFEWLHRAADSGNSEAALQLALHYEAGEGREKAPARAARYYRQAAEAGFEGAWLRWGLCLAEGKGTPKDAAEAVKWYKKAFYKRDSEAALLLAECYEKGDGVPKNTKLATELRQLVEPGGE